MRWTSWLPRFHPRRLSVMGLDMGPDVCSLVVLSDSPSQPDTVCCAERLALPEGLVAHGEVVQPVELVQLLLALALQQVLEAHLHHNRPKPRLKLNPII